MIIIILKAIKGAVAVVSAKDIPQNGKNDFMLGLAGYPEIVCTRIYMYIVHCVHVYIQYPL